jgi:cytochrome d ubiquinol oxidase subunit I
MFLIGWVDVDTQTTTGISIPCLLSFLSYQNINAVVQGLTSFPQDTWASVNLVFQVYHIMIDLGFLFIPLGLLGVLFYYWKRKLWTTRWLL